MIFLLSESYQCNKWGGYRQIHRHGQGLWQYISSGSMDNDDAAESEEEHQWGGSQMISLLTQTLPQGTFDSISCFLNVTFLILELSRIFFLTSHRAYLMSIYVRNFFLNSVFRLLIIRCLYKCTEPTVTKICNIPCTSTAQ